jgi:hypothetical protein
MFNSDTIFNTQLEVKAQFGEERRKAFHQESIADLASLISCVTHEVGCRNPAIPRRLETAVFLRYFLQCSILPVCILWN